MSMTGAAFDGAAVTNTVTVWSEVLPPKSVAVTFTVWKPVCVNTTETVHVWLLTAWVAVPPVTCQGGRNVRGAFTLTGPIPLGGVLLVDDTADSKWTLTIVCALLRHAGAGAVHPLVLLRRGPA